MYKSSRDLLKDSLSAGESARFHAHGLWSPTELAPLSLTRARANRPTGLRRLVDLENHDEGEFEAAALFWLDHRYD